MRWVNIKFGHDLLVASDDEILDEVNWNFGVHTVRSTGKRYISEQGAKAAAEKRHALNELNKIADSVGESL